MKRSELVRQIEQQGCSSTARWAPRHLPQSGYRTKTASATPQRDRQCLGETHQEISRIGGVITSCRITTRRSRTTSSAARFRWPLAGNVRCHTNPPLELAACSSNGTQRSHSETCASTASRSTKPLRSSMTRWPRLSMILTTRILSADSLPSAIPTEADCSWSPILSVALQYA